MVLVNFWEIYSSDLKCQHRPLNTVPWSVLESLKYDFQTKLRRVECSLQVSSLLLTQGSMKTTMASFNTGSHDTSGAGVNLRSTGLLGKIFRSQWLWWWQINKKSGQVMLQISMIHLEYFIFMNTTFGYFILSLLSCQVLYLVYVYYFL